MKRCIKLNEDFFKISIIDAGLNIKKSHSIHPDKEIDDIIKHLKIGPATLISYDYETAKSLGENIGWDLFCDQGSRQEQLRETLMKMIMELEPFWAKISYLGREKVKQFLTPDQVQCLEYANLLGHDPSDEIISWWEKIGLYFRHLDEENKLKIGREGEKKSLELEKKRLKSLGISKEPVWIAIEDNTAGFDILSYRENAENNIEEIRIEVKSCTYNPTHFILTKNEWETALQYQRSYIFHIWNFEEDIFTEMTVNEIVSHVPTDNGDGDWKEVIINLY
jgi:hypothetical protein